MTIRPPIPIVPAGEPDRRRFLKLMAASAALAGAGCSGPPAETIVPYVDMPENAVPGQPLFYATAFVRRGLAHPVLVETNMGRPTKIEGHPTHPASMGATDVYAQASVLQLWDPDRSQVVRRGARVSTWEAFEAALAERRSAWSRDGGARVRVLVGPSTSPALAAQLRGLVERYPKARWQMWDPLHDDGAAQAATLAFGRPADAVYRLDRAAVVLAADADLFGHWPGSVRHARDFTASRRLGSDAGANRLYALESSPTLTGAYADNRLALGPAQIEASLWRIAAHLGIGTLDRSPAIGAAPSRSQRAQQTATGASGAERADAPVPRGAPATPGPARGAAGAQALGPQGAPVAPGQARGGVRADTLALPAAPTAGGVAQWEAAVARALAANKGRSLVAAGPALSADARALVHRMNEVLGNVGSTVQYIEPLALQAAGQGAALAELVRDMQAGAVDTLLILDANPVYTAPADVPFAQALARVPFSAHLGLYRDETAQLTQWHLPATHGYEQWSDARTADGTTSIVQPMIAPLYGGRSMHEVLSLLADPAPRTGHAILRAAWHHLDDDAWRATLQRGYDPATTAPPLSLRAASTPQPASSPQLFAASAAAAAPPVPPAPWPTASASAAAPPAHAAVSATAGAAAAAPPAHAAVSATAGAAAAAPPAHAAPSPTGSASALALVFQPDPAADAGEFANNAWLQELPRPLTQLTWDNAAHIGPRTAARLALRTGDVVTITANGRTLQAPIYIQPSHAEDTVTLTLGQGRSAAGPVGTGVGYNAYLLRTLAAPAHATVTNTGARHEFAFRQQEAGLHGRDLIKSADLQAYRNNRQFATTLKRDRTPSESLYPPHEYNDYKWAMSIDLNTCIGCGACTIACQAENNIPVVGKEQVSKGRAMHWIRVDHYDDGQRHRFQPVPCMHCENAPCEEVCPVGATVHDNEGLNVQVYNRCVGTRFCSNNCPYKVRRFNFLEYTRPSPEPLKAQRNPEVTVRGRGVMEKCSYCLQRITRARIDAEKLGRRIADGEVVTACQAVCPTQAIVFGDLNDPKSAVNQAKASPLDYALLAELNTRPRTTYAARVINPDPEIP